MNVAWTNVSGFHIPSNAVVIGSTSHHEKLYMGRTFHDGTLTPGKVIIIVKINIYIQNIMLTALISIIALTEVLPIDPM